MKNKLRSYNLSPSLSFFLFQICFAFYDIHMEFSSDECKNEIRLKKIQA